MQFEHDLACVVGLYVNGCGLEQQLESIYRALVTRGAAQPADAGAVNGGFLRDDATLAILVLSDEDDGSVRDCRFADGRACDDAREVYDPASTRWSSASLNLRDYLYEPGSAQDPTWPLDRYVDPRDARRGLYALKPGHPERIVFAAITGVPFSSHRADGTSAWDLLLGTPAAAAPDDFVHRGSADAYRATPSEGPISMQQANADPHCSERVVPSCRAPGTTYDPMVCTSDRQYFAWPSRRIVEIARRFDEGVLCAGQPCHNGMVFSICDMTEGAALQTFADRVVTRQ